MALKSSSSANPSGKNVSEEKSLPPLARAFLWADSDTAVDRLVLGLTVFCVLLALLDFVVHRHTYVPGEGFPAFYALLGFIAFSAIVLLSRALRKFIKRDETFYAPHSVDAEVYPDEGLERLTYGESPSSRCASGAACVGIACQGARCVVVGRTGCWVSLINELW